MGGISCSAVGKEAIISALSFYSGGFHEKKEQNSLRKKKITTQREHTILQLQESAKLELYLLEEFYLQ